MLRDHRPNNALLTRGIHTLILSPRLPLAATARALLCLTTHDRRISGLLHPTIRANGVVVYSHFDSSALICRKLTRNGTPRRVTRLHQLKTFTANNLRPSLALIFSTSPTRLLTHQRRHNIRSHCRRRKLRFRRHLHTNFLRLIRTRPRHLRLVSTLKARRRIATGILRTVNEMVDKRG